MVTRLQVLEAQVKLLREAHEVANAALRSSMAVASREGRKTNWSGLRASLRYSLAVSHAAMDALREADEAMEADAVPTMAGAGDVIYVPSEDQSVTYHGPLTGWEWVGIASAIVILLTAAAWSFGWTGAATGAMLPWMRAQP